MKIDLKQIEAFIWVADLGSFRKAAARLNTTQPNISARISRLEKLLNVTLMERDAGSVRLTTRGVELLAKARNILRETENFILAADDHSLFNDVLKLGVTEMIVQTWLQEFLLNLKYEFPDLVVEITVDLSKSLESELFDKGIDLAIQNEPFSRDSSECLPLGQYPMIWVASPSLGIQTKKTVSVEGIVAYPILTHARDTRPYEQVVNHFSGKKVSKPQYVSSSNLSACIQMAVDGYGVAIVPAAMVEDMLVKGELIKVNYSWQPKDLSFFARYDASKTGFVVKRASEISRKTSRKFLGIHDD
ncbi:MAG: LysR family transcriptional regulator [Gammaproteobacteria bacterium]|nr:LysR family transcriptional regulator [Gammaproteobacteria bacterium]